MISLQQFDFAVTGAGIRCPLGRAMLVAFALASTPCWADIYKSVDSEGRVTYSNLPSKGAKRVDISEGNGNGKSKSASIGTPTNFPKVDTNTQKSRDSVRRRILSEELTAEEKLLAEAQSTYRNGNPDPLPGEQPTNPKYIDRVKKLRQSVELHEKKDIRRNQQDQNSYQ